MHMEKIAKKQRFLDKFGALGSKKFAYAPQDGFNFFLTRNL